MSVPTWTLVIPPADGRSIYSANSDHRASRWEVRNRRLEWKEAAYYEAKHAGIPRLGHARVELVIHLRNWRRADPQNYPSASSVKGLLDGLVAAGVVTDDRPPYLDVAMPALRPLEGGGPRVVVTITPAPYAPARCGDCGAPATREAASGAYSIRRHEPGCPSRQRPEQPASAQTPARAAPGARD